ncbi:MAG: Fe-Mn family superoxide dismutase [Candidatus Nanoarchaeia archaeon]|nr:Fe-Mn family superoxide dismutase [Candidatus Nanoarchaeia archaeon]
MVDHKVKDYSHLKGKIKGLSEKQLEAHFGLYKGYVNKYIEITKALETAEKAGNYSYTPYSALMRAKVVAWNGTFLHELYFENLTGSKTEPSSDFKSAVESSFGSWDKFVQDIKAAAASTPGWVLITWNPVEKRIDTYIVFEHHIGLPAGQEILLALDCWEHAFMIDYGTDKATYVNTFLDNVDWNIVGERFSSLK